MLNNEISTDVMLPTHGKRFSLSMCFIILGVPKEEARPIKTQGSDGGLLQLYSKAELHDWLKFCYRQAVKRWNSDWRPEHKEYFDEKMKEINEAYAQGIKYLEKTYVNPISWAADKRRREARKRKLVLESRNREILEFCASRGFKRGYLIEAEKHFEISRQRISEIVSKMCEKEKIKKKELLLKARNKRIVDFCKSQGFRRGCQQEAAERFKVSRQHVSRILNSEDVVTRELDSPTRF